MQLQADGGGRSRRARAACAAWIACGLLALAPLVLTGYLSRWSRYEADDFSVAVRLEELGLVGAWLDQLQVLNGRFFGYLLVDLLVALGPRRSWIATVLAMLGMLGATLTITRLGRSARPRRFAAAALLASGVVLSSPAPDQTFLWISGVGMVTASLVLAGLAVGLAQAAAAAAGTRRALMVGTAVAAFLASGAYETTALVLVVAGTTIVVATSLDHARPGPVVALTLGAAAGFTVVAAIPGSRARIDTLARGHDLVTAVQEGVVATADLLRTTPTSKAIWIGLAAGLLLRAPSVSGTRRARWWGAVVVAGVGAIAAAYSFSYWTLGAPPPSRTAFVLEAVLVGAAYAIGWIAPLRPMLAPAVALAALWIGATLVEPMLDGVAARQAWASRWDERDVLLRHSGSADAVEVPLVHSPAGLEEVGPDPSAWVNEAVAGYYDVASVVATDVP